MSSDHLGRRLDCPAPTICGSCWSMAHGVSAVDPMRDVAMADLRAWRPPAATQVLTLEPVYADLADLADGLTAVDQSHPPHAPLVSATPGFRQSPDPDPPE